MIQKLIKNFKYVLQLTKLSIKLFLIPNVFISLIPLIDSVVKDVNLSCSAFLSLCTFFIFGLYILIIINNIPTNKSIYTPIIHELRNIRLQSN